MKNTPLSYYKKSAVQLTLRMKVIEVNPFQLDLAYLIIRHNFLD